MNICRADDIDDTIFTNTKFQVKETFNIPDGIRVTIHARRSIDIYRMVEGIKYDGSETMNSVKQKIDAKRTNLFPNEEIIVALTDEKSLSNFNIGGSVITNIKQIMWWNNSNPAGHYWYAYYISQAADLFTYVKNGSYTVYEDLNGRYTKLFTLAAGHDGTWLTWGGSMRRGYKGTANNSSNKADIVMNFYNSY